jgi:hypothetical protein
VNWVEVAYTGSEGSVVNVCALHREETQRDFTVNVTIPNTPGMRSYMYAPSPCHNEWILARSESGRECSLRAAVLV